MADIKQDREEEIRQLEEECEVCAKRVRNNLEDARRDADMEWDEDYVSSGEYDLAIDAIVDDIRRLCRNSRILDRLQSMLARMYAKDGK